MVKHIPKPYRLVLFVVLIVLLIVGSMMVDAEQIVNSLGSQNLYIVMFIAAFFGGFSGGGISSFLTVLGVMIAGGGDPVRLGIVSGVSLAIGDALLFTLGRKGREDLPVRWAQSVERFAHRFRTSAHLKRWTPVYAYLYMSFAPLPNDILLFILVAADYKLKRLFPVMVLADITFALVSAIVLMRVV